ncbi:MAG: hypothetical protein ACPGLV_07860 [Bacteroidia bacterium]
MKNLISLLILLFIGCQVLGQDTFYVELEGGGTKKYRKVYGCEDLLVTLTFPYNSNNAPDSVIGFYNNKQAIGKDDWNINNTKHSISRFLMSGKYGTFVKVYRNGQEKTVIGDSIIVYKNPEADFKLLNDSIQCYRNNEFCLIDNSNSDSISNIWIDLGDGLQYRLNTDDTICHTYGQSGDFEIVYRVTDNNGCIGEVKKKRFTTIADIGANFEVKTLGECSKRQVIIKNYTPIDTSKVKSWHYQIGDFKTISYAKSDLTTKWLNDTFNVIKDGVHDIMLVVESTDGCKDSLIMRDAVKVFNPDLNVEMVSTAEYLCVDDTIQFKWNKSETVDEFKFEFGDPNSMQENSESDNPNPSHTYSSGGSYILSLTAKSYGCDDKDTAICCVNINGPKVTTKLPSPPFSGLNPVFKKDYIERLNANSSFHSTKTQISYYAKEPGITVDSQKVSKLPKYFRFGTGEDIGPNGQRIKYPSIADTNAYLGYAYDTVNYKLVKKVWERGTAIPKEAMYKAARPNFGLEKHQLHDTLIFADPEHDSLTITFPNFTLKFRAKNNFGKTGDIWIGFDAFPMEWRNGSLNGLNPSYPFASDSLEYFWDFNDPEAENCISTITNPNPNCNYSREKIPTHIFKENGCFSVNLTATDTLTGCSNTVIQPISFEKPVASFDKAKYTEMNWYKQKEILAKTGSLEGLGLFLDGNLCV